MNHKNNNFNNKKDNLLYSEFQDLEDKITAPDKEKSWNDLLHRIEEKENSSKNNKSLFKKFSIAAVIILIFFSGVLVGSYNGATADFQVINTMKSVVGDTVKITTNVKNERNYPKDIELQKDKFYKNIGKIQSFLEYSLKLPEYVPERFTFKGIKVINPDYHSSGVQIHYSDGSDEVIISEDYIPGEASSTYGFRKIDTEVKQVNINGFQGTLIHFKRNDTRTLFWHTQKYHFTIRDDIKEKEILKMARSIY